MSLDLSQDAMDALNQQLSEASARDVITHALQNFGDNVAISFSGAEDVVLIDLAAKAGLNFRVFTLDTGRLHPETYDYLERVRKHYGVKIEVCTPNGEALSEFVSEKGLFSFYEDGHKECCQVRKVAPLRAKLQTLDAWITGQRKDQSPGTRTEIPTIQNDTFFGSEDNTLVKYNPLAAWSSERVWAYIRANEVPYNELHEKGYISIGCQPCTRPVLPNQHEREGRWWWEDATKKECGLHVINIDDK